MGYSKQIYITYFALKYSLCHIIYILSPFIAVSIILNYYEDNICYIILGPGLSTCGKPTTEEFLKRSYVFIVYLGTHWKALDEITTVSVCLSSCLSLIHPLQEVNFNKQALKQTNFDNCMHMP